jgi:hypothetical protein
MTHGQLMKMPCGCLYMDVTDRRYRSGSRRDLMLECDRCYDDRRYRKQQADVEDARRCD